MTTVAMFSASASADTESPTTVTTPAYVAPLKIKAGREPARGRTFTFSWEYSCMSPQRGTTLNETVLIERPKTKKRPYKSALLWAMGNFPPLQIFPVVYCTADVRFRAATVTTKRPAKKVIFFDASTTPPRRIWPPAGTPPEK